MKVAPMSENAFTASPTAAIINAIWQTRTAPTRTIGPAAARATIAATA